MLHYPYDHEEESMMLHFSKVRGTLVRLVLALGLVSMPLISVRSRAFAQNGSAPIWIVRSLNTSEYGGGAVQGLAFSSRANAFQVIEVPGASANIDVIKLTPFADQAGSARIAAAIKDPINVAFDNRAGRLLILDNAADQLVEVREDAEGDLDPQIGRAHV